MWANDANNVTLTGDVSAAHVVGWDVFIYVPRVWLFEPAP